MTSHRQLLLCFLLGLAPAAPAQEHAREATQQKPLAPPAARTALASYRGFYALRLRHDATPLNGGVLALKGHLEVRVERSCDGWSTRQSLGFRMLGEEGAELEHLAYLNSFEENAGAFTFSAQSWEDRQPVERVAGVVARDPHHDRITVRYSEPEAAQQQLPAQTLFPAEHAHQVFEAARAGKRVVMHTVFDGSTTDNPFQISSWIGPARAPRAGDVGELSTHASWPLRLAYFALNATDPLPQFEMSVVLYDNGVAGDMIYDYGDFAVDVILKDITLLPAAKCD